MVLEAVEREEKIMKNKWSVGINVIAYYYIITAFLPYFKIALLTVSSGHLGLIPNNIYTFIIAHPWDNLSSLLLPIIFGIGILRRKEVIRKFILYASLLIVIIGIVSFLFPEVPFPEEALFIKIFVIIFCGWFVWLFSHPRVKELFK